APAASYFGRRLRSLAAVELFPNYLALKAHIGFLPCVVYGSLTYECPRLLVVNDERQPWYFSKNLWAGSV
ncbi:hypothetical protein, partial [Pseudomonas gessardii]|uniref:hypothetical protein n=1 Tax=Pseudomonas gessardii TaxID=78544 RepID=UPI001F195D98